MVGHPVLRKVVGADLLRSFAGSHLRTAGGGLLALLLVLGRLEQPRSEIPHRFLAVLALGSLLLHLDLDPRGLVRDPHGRVRRVDALAAGAG